MLATPNDQTRSAQLVERLLADGPALICGSVNVTPDSFFDGGRHHSATEAVQHGLRLAEQGVDILDVGGESTRPGARRPSSVRSWYASCQ